MRAAPSERAARRRMLSRRRAAIIGYGAITRELLDCLVQLDELDRVVGVLDLPERLPELRAEAAGRFPVVDNMDDLLRNDPDMVIECAGQTAVKKFGADLLGQGYDMLIASVGALTDDDVVATMSEAAAGKARILIPSGAVAGIDGLLAARTAGLEKVVYTSAKPPHAWKGTPAEHVLDLDQAMEATIFFEGSARQAASTYPQNANVAATVALAGLGFDRTEVRLSADASVNDPVGYIVAEGRFGRFDFEILANASPQNPKTSLITAHSIVHALRYDSALSVFDEGKFV